MATIFTDFLPNRALSIWIFQLKEFLKAYLFQYMLPRSFTSHLLFIFISFDVFSLEIEGFEKYHSVR